jgi:hypothetical protein
MFEELEKDIREKVTKARNFSDEKARIIELLNQIIVLEKLKDDEHVRLLAEKKTYRNGESVVSFHLKVLKELIEKL